jgi:hypothetical protein
LPVQEHLAQVTYAFHLQRDAMGRHEGLHLQGKSVEVRAKVVWLPFEVWQARQTKVLLYQVIDATNLFPHHAQEAQELRALAALELAQGIFEDIGMQKDRRQRITELVRQ